MTDKKEDNQRITEPGELDVLCGRGGMSNHHAGNEWYRRLIKSNRPLYRACPKHTKLLVSKAIVQAVEQQGGRFLEKNRGDNTWYQVTYKRAVDKTSQGLRERDRDDGEAAAAVPADAKPMISPPPALKGAAAAAMINKNGTKPPFKKRTTFAESTKQPSKNNGLSSALSAMGGMLQPSSNNKSPKKRTHDDYLQNAAVAPKAKRSRDDATGGGGGDEDFAPLPPSLQQRESSMFRLLKQTKLLVGQSEHWSSGANAPATTPGLGSVVAPGGVMPQQASLQNYPTKLNNLGNDPTLAHLQGMAGAAMANHNLALRGKAVDLLSQRQQMDPTAAAMASVQQEMLQLHQQQQQQQQLLGGGGGQAHSALGGPTVSNVYSAPAPYASSNGGGTGGGSGGGAEVPALTRLTSQMSDWLTSFWPVATRGESVAAPGVLAASGGNQGARPGGSGGGGLNNNSNSIDARFPPSAVAASEANRFSNLDASAAGGASASTLANFEKEVAPKLVNVPPPKIEMPPITAVPPMAGGGKRDKMGDASAVAAPFMSTAGAASSKPNKRKSSPGLPVPQMPLDGDAAPAPTELEQSVSATLLKLAGTPSKLYSGISSLFGSGNNDAAGPDRPAEGGVPMPATAPVVGMKRSSGSLMDDDDEDEDDIPVKATTRISGRRSSGSLMDDDDDTPSMEERLRGSGTLKTGMMGSEWRS